ncbi:MAG: hypothetical protein Kow0084_13950 [Pseudothermotoga elfii]
MEEVLWKGFTVYYYDEEDGRNYFQEFIKNHQKIGKYLARFMSFMDDIDFRNWNRERSNTKRRVQKNSIF